MRVMKEARKSKWVEFFEGVLSVVWLVAMGTEVKFMSKKGNL